MLRWETFHVVKDLNCVPNSTADASFNTQRMNAALQYGNLIFPYQEFFTTQPLKSARRIGGFIGAEYPTRGYVLGSDEFSSIGDGGNRARITRINGEEGGSVIRLCGNGQVVQGLALSGRPVWSGVTGTGTKVTACIEVEGNNTHIASGQHTIDSCLLQEASYGIQCLAGYYNDSNVFVADENHADNSWVTNCFYAKVLSCFRSENQQAVNWGFDHNQIGLYDSNAMVVYDLVRGGSITCTRGAFDHPKLTIFKVQDYSPNNRRLVCRDFKWELFTDPAQYLTLFHYNGPIYAGTDMSWIQWHVRITGHIPSIDPTYDYTKLIVINDGAATIRIYRNDMIFDIENLPLTNFTQVAGQYYRPT